MSFNYEGDGIVGGTHSTPRRVDTQPVPQSTSRCDGVTITELASALDTTVRALRYYEDAGLLRPHRNQGNARRYGPEDRETARIIVALRQASVKIESIAAIMCNDGRTDPKQLTGLLEGQLAIAEKRVIRLRQILSKLGIREG